MIDQLSIPKLCKTLLEVYEARGQAVGKELLPGLTREEFDRQTTWFPVAIPNQVRELYSWRNGQPNDVWSTECPFRFRDMQFISVEVSHAEYESMMATYGVALEGVPVDVDLSTSFPIASFNGGWYVVPCAGHRFASKHRLPVISVFQGIDIHFASVSKMLETCIEWESVADFSRGYWHVPELTEMEIWKRHNPNVFSEKR